MILVFVAKGLNQKDMSNDCSGFYNNTTQFTQNDNISVCLAGLDNTHKHDF